MHYEPRPASLRAAVPSDSTARLCERHPFAVIRAGAAASAEELSQLARAMVSETLHEVGAVLFRNYPVASESDFERVAEDVTPELLEYDYASTPRTRRTGRIYTSTEYPAHQRIPPHNEMSYSTSWPRVLWFCCLTAAGQGGATTLADSREVYLRLDPGLRRRFEERKVLYVRNYGTGLDLSWQQAFATEQRSSVEAYCRRMNMAHEWKPGGVLETRQVCQAVASHPVSRDPVWFNQAHLFHVSQLDPEVREALLESVAPEELPRNAYYGDGEPLEESAIAEIRAAYEMCSFEFPWQEGDVLLVDNVRVAHGRAPFRGKRSVLVAMA